MMAPRNTICKAEESIIIKTEELNHSHQLLSKTQLMELRKIWEADKRVPTLSSRIALAQSYGVASKAVHNWFSRHKNLALKAGCFVEGTYHLLVPGWTPLVKVENQAPEVAQSAPTVQPPVAIDFCYPLPPPPTRSKGNTKPSLKREVSDPPMAEGSHISKRRKITKTPRRSRKEKSKAACYGPPNPVKAEADELIQLQDRLPFRYNRGFATLSEDQSSAFTLTPNIQRWNNQAMFASCNYESSFVPPPTKVFPPMLQHTSDKCLLDYQQGIPSISTVPNGVNSTCSGTFPQDSGVDTSVWESFGALPSSVHAHGAFNKLCNFPSGDLDQSGIYHGSAPEQGQFYPSFDYGLTRYRKRLIGDNSRLNLNHDFNMASSFRFGGYESTMANSFQSTSALGSSQEPRVPRAFDFSGFRDVIKNDSPVIKELRSNYLPSHASSNVSQGWSETSQRPTISSTNRPVARHLRNMQETYSLPPSSPLPLSSPPMCSSPVSFELSSPFPHEISSRPTSPGSQSIEVRYGFEEEISSMKTPAPASHVVTKPSHLLGSTANFLEFDPHYVQSSEQERRRLCFPSTSIHKQLVSISAQINIELGLHRNQYVSPHPIAAVKLEGLDMMGDLDEDSDVVDTVPQLYWDVGMKVEDKDLHEDRFGEEMGSRLDAVY